MIHLSGLCSSRHDAQEVDLPREFRARALRRSGLDRGVELASETVVGQSSNNPFSPSETVATGTANPFELGSSPPQLSPFAAPAPHADLRMSADDATYEEAAPSRQDLLQRAAELGPARMTWASIVLPADPILADKMQPRVAERRARFRKVVKVALGACVAFCLVATAASAVSSTSTQSSASSTMVKTTPASGVVPVEKLEVVMRTKAPSKVTAAVRPRPTPKKRR